MFKKVLASILMSLVLMPQSFSMPTPVSVGGYLFPPFIYNEKDAIRGITIDLIKLLNESQTEYIFDFHLTSSKRRYKDFSNKHYDLLFFEDMRWGWKDKEISPTKVILKGGEVFITHASNERNQDFFKDLSGKKILGILGYHYKFANYNSDRVYLKENFNVELRTNHLSNIHTIAKRNLTQVAIVTKSLLKQFLKRFPHLKNKILISNELDQEYKHTILVRENSRPTTEEVNSLIKKLYEEGQLKKLWDKYGIEQSDRISF